MSQPSRRRLLQVGLSLLGFGLSAGCGSPALPVRSASRLPRIGYLRLQATIPAWHQAFRDGLRELGYQDGQNIMIEERLAESIGQLPGLAAELVGLPVDLLVAAAGYPSIEAARGATQTVPIVFPVSGDPVQAGYVASLAHPGGNATGLSILAPQVAGKRLQLLRDFVPGLSRVLFLTDTADPATRNSWDAREAAQALGLQLVRPELRNVAELPAALATGLREQVEAVLVNGQAFLTAERKQIIEHATTARLPLVAEERSFAADGGLSSYGAARPALYRRAAVYVDKILKGAQPADLPVEQPTTFDFVLNLRTATALGLMLSPAILAQATEIIQ